MSCSGCGLETCGCVGEINPDDDVNPGRGCTVCTGDVTNNVWFVARAPGFAGRCILDELTFDQVAHVLSKNPRAKADLLRITTDPRLVRLANEAKLVETDQTADERFARKLNSDILPHYTVTRGKLNGDF